MSTSPLRQQSGMSAEQWHTDVVNPYFIASRAVAQLLPAQPAPPTGRPLRVGRSQL
ncbi:MAG: hypothetical protein R3B90_04875 [Planctomycetaceae bacterium]